MNVAAMVQYILLLQCRSIVNDADDGEHYFPRKPIKRKKNFFFKKPSKNLMAVGHVKGKGKGTGHFAVDFSTQFSPLPSTNAPKKRRVHSVDRFFRLVTPIMYGTFCTFYFGYYSTINHY